MVKHTTQKGQRFTILTLVLALGVAVYLNWEYARTKDLPLDTVAAEAAASTDAVTDALTTAGAADGDTAEKTYGEAQLVSAAGTSTGFFDTARLNREQSRDAALDTMKKSLKNAELTQAEKDSLTEQVSAQVAGITAESEIETLIKAKGFLDCVVFLDGETVNVTVMTAGDGLTQNEVAQIRDIVMKKWDTSAQNITVVEVK